MIETKEQYEEHYENFQKISEQQTDAWISVVQTIEALRDVARAGDRLEISFDMRTSEKTIDGFRNQIDDFEQALDALPDWITDG